MADAETTTRPPGPITLDQLLALNEEVAALVRAGLPLGRGLLEAGRDIRGRLGRIAGALGRRLNRGEGLAEALEAERGAIPPLYRAVVEAGARAGRLPVALEGMARYIRGLAEARRAIGLALWYPGLVVALAYGLFIGLVALVVPRLAAASESLGLPESPILRRLEWAGSTVQYWWPIGPVALAALAILWIRSGTTAGLRGGTWGGLRRIPWMGRLLADFEAANFAELLGLMLEHRVPYPSAMVLAAEAAGSGQLVEGARRASTAMERGEPPAAAVQAAGDAFPPMLRWTLAVGPSQGALDAALYHLADLYRQRARNRAEHTAVLLPAVLTLAVGASAAGLYGLALFLPLIEMLRGLSAG